VDGIRWVRVSGDRVAAYPRVEAGRNVIELHVGDRAPEWKVEKGVIHECLHFRWGDGRIEGGIYGETERLHREYKSM